MLPIIPTRIHGFMDYIVGTVLLMAPYVLGFADHGPAQWVPMVVGAVVIAVSMVTDYEASLARIVPMPVHLAGDVLGGLFLAASPWLFSFADEVYLPHLAFGVLSVVTGLITRPHSPASIQPDGTTHLRLNANRIVAAAIVLVTLAVSIVFGWIGIVDHVQQAHIDALGPNAPRIGAPIPWQMNFPLPESPIQLALYNLHNLLFVVNIAITALVVMLIAYTAFRFHRSRNPEPSRTTHNAPLEVVWTVLPVLTLLALSIPTFRNLRLIEVPPASEMTLKVTGRQWYWEYEYPDQNGLNFASTMIPDDKLGPERAAYRMMTTDNPVVLPVETTIRVQVTSGDVIHGWGMPSLGIMRDAIPGRLNETWTRIEREGVYFGNCRELCGRNHAYMPVEIHAVSRERFDAWVAESRQRQASGGGVAPSPLNAAAQPADIRPVASSADTLKALQ